MFTSRGTGASGTAAPPGGRGGLGFEQKVTQENAELQQE
jgi:hypothetical protein